MQVLILKRLRKSTQEAAHRNFVQKIGVGCCLALEKKLLEFSLSYVRKNKLLAKVVTSYGHAKRGDTDKRKWRIQNSSEFGSKGKRCQNEQAQLRTEKSYSERYRFLDNPWPPKSVFIKNVHFKNYLAGCLRLCSRFSCHYGNKKPYQVLQIRSLHCGGYKTYQPHASTCSHILPYKFLQQNAL